MFFPFRPMRVASRPSIERMRLLGVFRSRLPWVVGALALSTLAADSAVLSNRQAPLMPISVAVEERLVTEDEEKAAERESRRDDATRDLFRRRAEAVRNRDRAAFLADLDGTDKEFVRRQGEVFDSLGKLEFSAWEYSLRDEQYSLSNIAWKKYATADDLALPVLTLHYQLKGYDKRPVVRRVVYTLVERNGHWRIANDRDLEESTTSGTSVRRDPWENGPIVVKKTANGLVIGHPDDAEAIDGIQREVQSAVKHVSSYVGRTWGEKTVVILPSNHEELQYLLENPDVPYEFAAVASPEFTTLEADYLGLFAGTRVVINPENFSPGAAFNRLLIRHEITHVAMFERTGPLTPKWFVEGIAEYVGNAGSDLPAYRLASELAELVDEEGVPDYLPLDSDFGIIGEAGVGYNAGWLLCRYIASRWGRAALLKFYDEMGTREGLDKPSEKLGTVLKSVLRTDEAALLKAWRPYVRAAVGDPRELLVKPNGYSESGRGSVDASELAKDRKLSSQAVRATGMERGAEGFWYTGAEKSPAHIVEKLVVVARDDAGAAKIAAMLGQAYAKYDSGRPIPGGRLYLVGFRLGGKEYNEAVAVVRSGIAVFEVGVAFERYGDPSADARAMAAAQLKALAA